MRQSGILLHITSLPSPGGIGTLGADAYHFVDFLEQAGMKVWQVLPISPTGYGDSPYQSVSTFAGNPLLIDLETLMAEGYLPEETLPDAPEDTDRVDFGRIVEYKTNVLKHAFRFSKTKMEKHLERFMEEQPWVEDYALFSAIKEHFGSISWINWPDEDIRMRKKAALKKYAQKLKESVDYYVFIQYFFFRQWHQLKEYANKKGISLFGDIPIYTAEDSADVWKNPQVFQLDAHHRPLRIAGVPPDYFSEDGQRWGNPLYDWDYLKETDYRWWIKRLKFMGNIYDIVRVDHFIGFANYYSISAKEDNARNGAWIEGPGRSFFKVVKRELPDLRIVAEDLGAVNARVTALLDYCGYPGMKVMTFGFSGNPADPHLPQNYKENCVVYTGTHDNSTALGWLNAANAAQKQYAFRILSISKDEEFSDAMVRAALMSRGKVCVLPLQDILGLSDEARMNIPSTIGGHNWQWRMLPGDVNDTLAGNLKTLNILSGRTGT